MTYGEMVSRIGDETLRSDMVPQIKLCVQEAIAHFEVEPFWFNQVPIAALSRDEDTNAWMQQAADLIRHRAKSIFYSQYLRDDANAARATALQSAAYERLMAVGVRKLAAQP